LSVRPQIQTDFKINNFDLLRLIAATQVVLIHTERHLDMVRPAWWPLVDALPGVPIFFVISGFLISASYERSSTLSSYARNRILRIFPGLWCCILLTIGVAAAFGFSFAHWSAGSWLLAQLIGLIYTPHFLKSFGFGSYNGSLWTIPIELQFYLVLPIFYYLTKRAGNQTKGLSLALLLFALIAFLANLLFEPLTEVTQEPIAQKLIRYSFFPHIYLFLSGVILQRLSVHRSRWIAGKALHWLAVYLLFHFAVPYSAVSYVIGTMLLGVVVIAAAYTRPTLSEHLLRGNDISYGVYIYHGLIINIFVEFGLGGRESDLAVVVLLAFLLGYLSWLLIERPFLRRKKQTIHVLASPAGLHVTSVGKGP
jgi:peptidoglycan/LPS O-acetylase OafA/YrhL